MFKPGDLFLGIVDFFALIIPGGLFSFGIYLNFGALVKSLAPLSETQLLAAFFFCSYFFGYIIAWFAEKIDKAWSPNLWVTATDEWYYAANRVRSELKADWPASLSIYQWCRSVLITTSPEAMADINGIVASADFFRNLYVTLPFVAVFCFVGGYVTLGLLLLVLCLASIRFSQSSRNRLHKRISNHVVVLHQLGKLRKEEK